MEKCLGGDRWHNRTERGGSGPAENQPQIQVLRRNPGEISCFDLQHRRNRHRRRGNTKTASMTRLAPRHNLNAGPIHLRVVLVQPRVPQNKTSIGRLNEEQHNRLTVIAGHNKTYTGSGVGDSSYRLTREAPDSNRRGERNGRNAPALGRATVQKAGFGSWINKSFAGVDGVLVSDGGRELGAWPRGDKGRNTHQDSPVN